MGPICTFARAWGCLAERGAAVFSLNLSRASFKQAIAPFRLLPSVKRKVELEPTHPNDGSNSVTLHGRLCWNTKVAFIDLIRFKVGLK